MEVNEKGCKLFVGGLSHDTTDATLLEYFKSFGKVISAVVLRDSETLSSRGFGFVSFSTRQEAQDCLDYGSVIIDNKEVEIKLAKPRPSYLSSAPVSEIDIKKNVNNSEVAAAHQDSDYITTKVFVGGLLYSTGADSLESYFNSFGEVESTEIIYNKETRISRGFGFVQFRNPQSVKNVINHQLNIERHKIDGKKVEVKRCLKKNEPLSTIQTNTDMRGLDSEDSDVKVKKAPMSIPLRKRASSSNNKVFSFADAAKSGTKFEAQGVRPNSTIAVANLSSASEKNIERLNFSLNSENKDRAIDLNYLPNFDDIRIDDSEHEHTIGFNKPSLTSDDKTYWQSHPNPLIDSTSANHFYQDFSSSNERNNINDDMIHNQNSRAYLAQQARTIAQQPTSHLFPSHYISNSPPVELGGLRHQSYGNNSYREVDEQIGEFPQFDYQQNSNWN